MLKDSRQYSQAATALRSWYSQLPSSDLSTTRLALDALVSYRTGEYARSIEAAEPLVHFGIRRIFRADGTGAIHSLQVLLAAALSICQSTELTARQRAVGDEVVRSLWAFTDLPVKLNEQERQGQRRMIEEIARFADLHMLAVSAE